MQLTAVMDDVAAGLETISGLRVAPYWPDRVNPPQAVVAWPEEITYDATMARGSDRFETTVTVLVGRADVRSARDVLAAYADGTGASSVKAALEAYDADSYHSLRVTRADFPGAIPVGGVDYLAVTFTLDIIGRGA